jgi:hypothetical protein
VALPLQLQLRKLAGKKYFPTYCNYLVFNRNLFKLNRCSKVGMPFLLKHNYAILS